VKNKIKFILLIITFLIAGCESINTSEEEKVTPKSKLKGKWNCLFEQRYLLFFPQSEPDTILSVIEFKGDSFYAVTGKPENILQDINNNLQLSSLRGRYEIEKDTIRFYLSGDEPVMEDFLFSTRGDRLNLRTAPKAGPNGFSIIRLGSFLWKGTFGKSSAVYKRIMERVRNY